MEKLSKGSMNNQGISGEDSKYLRPVNLKEALEYLSRNEDIKILAGGTDLLVKYYERLYEVESWLDLKDIKELKLIEVYDERIEIGAMITHSQLEESEYIKNYFPLLKKAASEVGSPQIRNRGTIGGNIANASPAGDLLPVLMAYDAQFRLASIDKEIILSADEFFIGPKRTILKKGQLLRNIILPIPGDRTYGSWIKIGKRKALSISTISLALVLKFLKDKRTVKDVRACFGSVAPTPVEIKELRGLMINQKFNSLNFNELGQIVAEKISPIDDIRGTKEYRKAVAKEIMINALEEIIISRG